MKRNMQAAMGRLEIDEGMRPLVRQLWKHNYKTTYSCDGHGIRRGYISFIGNGDGWLEENSSKYGLEKINQGSCCEELLRNLPDPTIELLRFMWGRIKWNDSI